MKSGVTQNTRPMKKQCPDVFAAIGDPTRRKMLLLLTAGSMSINRLAENFLICRPAVSKHVKALAAVQLISIEVSGREHLCHLDLTGFNKVRDWLAFYERFWNGKMKMPGKLHKKQAKHKKH